MKILIVHDRVEVSDRIVASLPKLGLTAQDAVVARDGVGARTALQTQLFDIAIVDLTIAHIENKTATSFTVMEELLIELFESSNLHTPGDIIGLTHDPEALLAITNQIGQHLMAVIAEDSAGAWEQQLLDKIQYTCRAAGSRLTSLNRHHDYDVAILTALDKEFAPYSNFYEFTDLSHFPGAKQFLFADRNGRPRKGVAYSIGRAGQASAASATQAIITQFRPELILMSGFCGGFSEKSSIGDVLIADMVFDWDFGRWQGAGNEAVFVPRPEPIGIRDTEAHRLARELVSSKIKGQDDIVGKVLELSGGRINGMKLRIGPMASGSSVVAEPSIIKRIQAQNENIFGVDMEAFGFFFAASSTPVKPPGFLVVKAVADHADKSKDDKDHEACCFLSAKIVQEIVERRWRFR